MVEFGAFGTKPAVVTDDDPSEDELRRTMVRLADGHLATSDTPNESGHAPRESRAPAAADVAPLGATDRTSPLTTTRATDRRFAAGRGRTLAAHPIGARR
ncbi:MAG: hypothetical protein ACJ8AO_12515 [Gemmatimonadaceae bacterium]